MSLVFPQAPYSPYRDVRQGALSRPESWGARPLTLQKAGQERRRTKTVTPHALAVSRYPFHNLEGNKKQQEASKLRISRK